MQRNKELKHSYINHTRKLTRINLIFSIKTIRCQITIRLKLPYKKKIVQQKNIQPKE